MIAIDESLCNGCGRCANTCDAGVIEIDNGKAVIVRDSCAGDCYAYCIDSCDKGAVSYA